MERTGNDIINKMLEYKDQPGTMEAMADMLLYMGISEAGEFLKEALKQQQDLKQTERDLQLEYHQYLRRAGSKGYISFSAFVEKIKKEQAAGNEQ